MSKTTIIRSLEIRDFKGTRHQAVDFHADRPTVISGRNATGKTTIMDAFTWLLWGLNSEDQQTASFGIKPNDADGNTIPDLNPEVEGVIETTDRETGETTSFKLKRRWVSVYRTRAGETERSLARNKGEYFIDDIPVRESQYRETIESILPPQIFKSITNPSYFARLKWQDKRAILMEMAGDVTYQDIARRAPEFEQLLSELSGKPLEDYNRAIATQVTRINTELAQIPARIQEAGMCIPEETPDFDTLEAEKGKLERAIADIDETLTATGNAEEKRTRRLTMLRGQLYDLAARQDAIILKARQQAAEEAAKANAERSDLRAAIRSVERRQAERRDKFDTGRRRLYRAIDDAKNRIAELKAGQDCLRQQWFAENARTYDQGAVLVCPITGTDCQDPTACTRHAEDWRQALADFNATQQARKEAITAKGKAAGQEIAKLEQQATEAEQRIQELAQKFQEEDGKDVARLKGFRDRLMMAKEAEPAEVKPSELPEWEDLEDKREKLAKVIETATCPDPFDLARIQEFRQKRDEARQLLDGINRQLALREVTARQQARIQELRESEKALIEERAGLQRKQAVADRLSRERMTEVEARVNRLFKTVRFQMFEPTQTTGEEKPNCIMWVGEARYSDKNKAGRVNAGLDVINALCRYHGITAPIFIDNAESVNEFIPTESQLVLLKVSTGDLTIQ